MKWIEYEYVCNENLGITLSKRVEYNEVNLAIAQAEAYDGNYTIIEEEDEDVVQPVPLAIEFGGTGAKNASDALENLGGCTKEYVNSRKVAVTATLTISGWSDMKQTVAVSGVSASNHVVVTAAPVSFVAWSEAVVYCSAQADGSLTFTCEEVPAADLTANILILN